MAEADAAEREALRWAKLELDYQALAENAARMITIERERQAMALAEVEAAGVPCVANEDTEREPLELVSITRVRYVVHTPRAWRFDLGDL